MAGSAPASRSHGEVEHHDAHGHGHHRAPAVVNGISETDEPSVEWGWHGRYRRAAQIGGFVSAAVCLLMLYGNHDGRTEDVFLVLFALVFAALSIRSIVTERTSWRR